MNKYVKNQDESDYTKIDFDEQKTIEAYKKHKKSSKNPTSVNLPNEVIADLKAIALKKGLPYQVLMRMIIIEGVDKLKNSA
ncbi:CopG family antitoxin [Spirobacillus cienkowskii]|uniref:CopG family antitoxin n=1 Tax=Spirobacillus cienkowskii TaxID=495820 RepID=UPI0030D1BE92